MFFANSKIQLYISFQIFFFLFFFSLRFGFGMQAIIYQVAIKAPKTCFVLWTVNLKSTTLVTRIANGCPAITNSRKPAIVRTATCWPPNSVTVSRLVRRPKRSVSTRCKKTLVDTTHRRCLVRGSWRSIGRSSPIRTFSVRLFGPPHGQGRPIQFKPSIWFD